MTLAVQGAQAPRINIFSVRAEDYGSVMTRMMRLEDIDPANFEQLTSFLARGTTEEVLMKLRMFTTSRFKQIENSGEKTAVQMLRERTGDCMDYAAFNMYVLKKAGITFTLFDAMQNTNIEAFKAAVFGRDLPTSHIFIVAESGKRLYRVDNHGIYYLGDRQNMSDPDILNFVSFQLNSDHKGSRCRQLETTDINTKRDVYSFLLLDRRAINASGGSDFAWLFGSTVRYRPFSIMEIKGYSKKNNAVVERRFGHEDLVEYYNSDLRHTAIDGSKKMTFGDISYSLMFESNTENMVDICDYCLNMLGIE